MKLSCSKQGPLKLRIDKYSNGCYSRLSQVKVSICSAARRGVMSVCVCVYVGKGGVRGVRGGESRGEGVETPLFIMNGYVLSNRVLGLNPSM